MTTTGTVSGDATVAKTEYSNALGTLAELEAHIDQAAATAESLQASALYTPEAKQQKLADLRATVVERAQQDRSAVAERLQTAEKRASVALAGQQDDPVIETRKSRATTRVNRLLDAGRHALEVAEVFTEAGDLDALRVLRDELPSFVAASTPEHGNRAGVLQGLTLAVDEAMRPMLPEAEQYAVDVRLGISDTSDLLSALMLYALHFDRPASKDPVTLARDLAAGRWRP